MLLTTLKYLGILFASAAFGPALGYMAGGQLLRIYVDFPALSSKEYMQLFFL